MLDFSLRPVHPFLRQYINMYAFMDLKQDAPMPTLFTAKTTSALMFKIGNSGDKIAATYDFPHHPQKSFTFYSHQAWLGGVLTEPNMSCMSGNINLLCVGFTPLGLHHLLRESATVLVNCGVSLDCLSLPNSFDDLTEKLQNISCKKQVLQWVEAEMLSYFSDSNVRFSIKDMSPVMNYIARRGGNVTVRELENKFRVSRRWLEKQFMAQVGISPKEYARITRFTAILSQANAARSVVWSTLLEDFGYYDQSHLIRDFQDFTGFTPAQYLKNSPNSVNNIFLKTLE